MKHCSTSSRALLAVLTSPYSLNSFIRAVMKWFIKQVALARYPWRYWFSVSLKEAWRGHRFPKRCFFRFFTENRAWRSEDQICKLFHRNVKRKTQKAKEHHQFCCVLGRWRTAAIYRTTFMPVSDIEQRPSWQFFWGFWVSFLSSKSLFDQECQFLTRNKSLSNENSLTLSRAGFFGAPVGRGGGAQSAPPSKNPVPILRIYSSKIFLKACRKLSLVKQTWFPW